MDASGAPVLSWSDRIQRVLLDETTFSDASDRTMVALPSNSSTDWITRLNTNTNAMNNFIIPPWTERAKIPPAKGTLRFLQPPQEDDYKQMWMCDHTLTEWIGMIGTAAEDNNTITMPDASGDPSISTQMMTSHYDTLNRSFARLQRPRYLARKVLNRWVQRIWAKRPQCNTDLIDNADVQEADAITLTDTTNHTLYRFHRRDIFNNLLSKISLSDEMLPNPQPPTNPWTNQALTLAQTISVCQKLVADFGRRGRCPPVLFAAFCAAGYDIKRFESENSGLLASHAITSYFKDIHDHNRDTVSDTMLQLLADSGVNYSPVAVRRWVRTAGAQRREWLNMVRDYTLYINLHIQVRRHWRNYAAIRADVRDLYYRTPMTSADVAGPRMRLLRNRLTDGAALLPSDLGYGFGGAAAASQPVFSSLFGSVLTSPFANLSLLLAAAPAPAAIYDASGSSVVATTTAVTATAGSMTHDEAIAIIQSALFRM